MPRKQSNYTRLKKLSADELATELKRIYSSEVLPYIDFAEWLKSDDSALIPHGRHVLAEVIIRESHSRMVVDRMYVECIIITDSQYLFNSRYYLIYDLTDGKIKSIEFENLSVVEL